MLKSDSSDLSVSSSLSESLINSDDDDSDDYDDDDVPDVKVTDIWIPVIQQEKTKCKYFFQNKREKNLIFSDIFMILLYKW